MFTPRENVFLENLRIDNIDVKSEKELLSCTEVKRIQKYI